MSRRWLWGFGLVFVYLFCFAWGSQYAAAQDPQPPAEEQVVAPADVSAEDVEGDQRFDLSALKDPDKGSGTTVAQRFQSLLGMAFLIGVCVLMSNNRSKISWKLVAWGLGLQLILGIFVMHVPFGQMIFNWFNGAFDVILSAVKEGASFLFGNLAKANNVPVGDPLPGEYPPFSPINGNGTWANVGAYFAFFVLPTIIVFSSLMAILYHVGFMQAIVKVVAQIMQATMGTTGAETLSASGNIFVGQTEAPLLVKPFIKGMSQSELMAVMTGGFATVAGGVMAAYVGMLQAQFAGIAGHLLSASVMSAPAALVCAKIMIPEPDPTTCETYGSLKVELEKVDVNAIDAAARGASEGLKLALNVGAMLLAFLALVALFNMGIGKVGSTVANLVYGHTWSERLADAQARFGGLSPEEQANLENQAALLDLAQEAAAASGLRTAATAEPAQNPSEPTPTSLAVQLVFQPEHTGAAKVEGLRIVFGPGSFLADEPGFDGVALPAPKAYADMTEAEQAQADSAWWESGWRDLSLQKILGFLLMPLAWLMGVPWEDARQVGQLIGIKTVVNEFVAYLQLADMCKPGNPNLLSNPRSVVIATYALCGFANLGSIGIQLGGIGGIAPERRSDLAKIGFRAMVAGTIAALLTATVAGMLLK